MANGTFSRERMVRQIEQGGSVHYNGRIITSIAELPGEAVLAAGDPERQAALRRDLDARIAALEAEREGLESGRAGAADDDDGSSGKTPADEPTARELVERVKTLTDRAELQKLYDAEMAREEPDEPRKTVIAAIEKQLDRLDAPGSDA